MTPAPTSRLRSLLGAPLALCLLTGAPVALAGAAARATFGVDIGPADPGCVLSVRHHDGHVAEFAAGARYGGGPKLDAHSNFRLASVSKQFTAMAVMLLVAEHRLAYDTTLAEVLPGWPAWAQRITVRHLLTHTSGLPDYEEAMDAAARDGGPRYSPTHQIQDADVLELLRREPALRFEPGTRWAYSNSGYVLLGLVVAARSGRPFADVLETRIFAPLGMRDTRVVVRGRGRVARRAYGHEPGPNGLVRADQSATSATQGDGGVYSSLRDLARWDAALRAATLLPAGAMRAALEPVRLSDGSTARWPEAGDEDDLAPGQPVAYGFGWFVDPLDAHARMWHFGTTRGFRTAIMRLPEAGVTAIALCNRSDLDARLLAERALREALAGRAR